MSEWPLRKIEDVADFLNHRRIPVKASDRATRQGVYPYYGASGIVDYVNDYLFDGDFLLVSEDGENLRSRNAPIAFMGRGKFWVNNHAHILDEKEPGILRYLALALNRTDLSPYITGAAQPKLNKRTLSQIEIPVPPTKERLEINSTLGALDDKIEQNRKTAATLEEMARTLYRSWFVDFGPVRARAEGRAPAHMDPTTAALFPDSFGEDGLPVGWRRGLVEELFTLQRGFDLPTAMRTEGPFPVMAAGGFHGTHSEFKVAGPGVTTGRSGVIGEVFLTLEDFWPLNTSLWVKEFKIGSVYFAYHFIQCLDLRGLNSGSAVPSLNRNNVHNLVTDVPPKQIIEVFDKVVAPVYAKVSHLTRENQTLASLRDTLLPRLMSGELLVGTAKKQVEEAV
ncbi:restriction endonuclease subunit S [Paracoccus alkanivorans]|uniref:Restriction endonuclease subunit S n=1 Tax=Paracoccus alkanivorans TaxID=2116655 RepID=A0A3M0MM97_9RHOB|nr:restriction endonuclease subunit S [Paracoccus alkanivorans]RMC37434.1 restriction endonuclease subunit S [Paracoccus alkanivorans]